MERHRTTLLLRALLIVGCIVGLAWPGVAGTGYNVKCGECDFETNVLYGGGIPGREPGGVVIGTGYCCSCGKFVQVFSKPEAEKEEAAADPEIGAEGKAADGEVGAEKKPAPGPIDEVFCHDNGKTYTLYACPHCGKPFIAIRAEELVRDGKRQMLFCPKCGTRSLSVSGEFLWD